MRILVATDQWFPDTVGGVARVATDTAVRWARRGHEVVVLAPDRGSDVPRTVPEQTHETLTVLRDLPRGRLPQTLSDTTNTRRWARKVGLCRFDVVVTHSATTGYGLVRSGLEAPLVYVFHASPADEAQDLRGRVGLGRAWLSAAVLEYPLRSLTVRTLERASRVIVLSEFSRGVLAQTSAVAAAGATCVPGAVDTIRFSPDGRDEARKRLGVAPSTKLVFTVRRHEPRMGLEALVDAAGLLDDVPDLQVAIAGGGDPGTLRARADELGIGRRVNILGRVSDDDLPLWHRAADLFVLPTAAYEGFGLVTVEALASGTPVVGTPVGATPELLQPLEPRLVGRGTDAVAIAEAIREGLSLATPEFRARCRSYAVDRFSWDAVLPGWEDVLREAVSREPSGSTAGDLHPHGAG